jgi:8-oxo-dGTP pyrophosphatase MutT (NUDIX family)
MPQLERSAGFVVYRVSPSAGADEIEFLLLDYGRHWDFPKGHVEGDEDDLTTAKRELKEETGISGVIEVPGFQREVTYYFRHKRNGLVRKTVVFFLAECATCKIVLSREHVGFDFLSFEEAVKRLTFPSARQVLRAAWEHLKSTRAATW